MKTIRFAKDYPKLQDNFFTTIRTPPKPLRTGTVCIMKTPTKEFKAILMMKRMHPICEIETSILTVDTDTHSREEALAVLREFYPDLEEKNEVQVLWFVHDRRD